VAVIHRLTDFDTEDYKLIAIHSSRKEDFKVVYLINTILDISLARQTDDVEIVTEAGVGSFSLFEFEDSDHHVLWKLVSNKTLLHQEGYYGSPLFEGDPHATLKRDYLFPELKTVDYLIKIEDTDEQFDIGIIIEKIKAQKLFSTAYEVRLESIKTKQNLIF
jgi:hypothetical protein